MEPTGGLITNPLEIPADALSHADIQAGAEIDYATLEILAFELGAMKLAVRTLSRVGWFYTKGEAIIAAAKQRGLSDWRHTGINESMQNAAREFNTLY